MNARRYLTSSSLSAQITELSHHLPHEHSSNARKFHLPNSFFVRYPRLTSSSLAATPTKFLGIESSCDDSCASVLSLSHDPARVSVETDVRISQHNVHAGYGGVVPHLAKKAHASTLPRVVDRALSSSSDGDIRAVFVTTGPGLSGSLSAGVREALRAGARLNAPVFGVNHLEAHVMTSELLRNDTTIDVTEDVFPFLTLVVSGGNTFVSYTREVGDHVVLAATRDDALGEALDKAARMLKIDGGGAELEKYARGSRLASHQGSGNATMNPLPIPNRRSRGSSALKSPSGDSLFFSFSGLKSALHRHLEARGATQKSIDPSSSSIHDLAFHFQDAAFTHVVDVVKRCIASVESSSGANEINIKSLVVSGGVASSQTMREKLRRELPRGIDIRAPPPHWCVDNAVMIAWTGMLRLGAGLEGEDLRFSRCFSSEGDRASGGDGDVSAMRGIIKPKWPLGVMV